MASTEYGVFNDQGCLERGFWDLTSTEHKAAYYRDEQDEEDAYASALCPIHEEQPASPSCEECLEELARE